MSNLTSRQSEIFEFIKKEIEFNGYPPTRSEIAKVFGFKSPNAAEDHICLLYTSPSPRDLSTSRMPSSA